MNKKNLARFITDGMFKTPQEGGLTSDYETVSRIQFMVKDDMDNEYGSGGLNRLAFETRIRDLITKYEEELK